MNRQVKSKWLRKQPAMRKVVLALLPCIFGGWYYFGLRVLAMIVFCCLWGLLLEWLFCRTRKEPASEAVFVTAVLFALVMPPGVGWHVVTIGMAFAVIFSKEVFGGFGRNFFNPALAGRCFVYICFPVALTGQWEPAATGPAGALIKWSNIQGQKRLEATTGATPMAHLKAGRILFTSIDDPDVIEEIPFKIDEKQQVKITKMTLLKGLLGGRISGTTGVTSAILITIGGLYLFWTKTASRTIILSLIIAYAVFNQILYRFGVDPVPGAWPAVLGGGFLFGAFYMATDPVSSPRTEPAKIAYGVMIALCTVVIRNFSIFNGGLMFSILLGNMFAPILDVAVKSWQNRTKNQSIAETAA